MSDQDRPMADTPDPTLSIPVPVVRPLGAGVDKPEYVHEVWDQFHQPEVPSVEERLLSAILRAVHEGLVRQEGGCSKCQQEDTTP